MALAPRIERTRRTARGGGGRASARPPLPVVLAALVTAAVATIPFWYLLVRAASAGLDKVVDVLSRPAFLDSALTSIALTVTVGVCAMLLGTAAAWVVGRAALPWPRWWTLALVLPLAVPSYVAAYAWVALFPGMRGFAAAVLVLTLATTPYVVLPVLAAMRQGEAAVEEVARSLGAGQWQVFRTVTLPAIWPAAAAGGLLVMLYTLSEFGTVAIFRVDTLTRDVFLSFTAAFDRTTAVIQSLALVAVAVVLVVAERRVRGSSQRWRVTTGAARQAPSIRLRWPWRTAALLGLSVLAVLSLGVPAVALTMRLIAGMRGGLDLAEIGAAAVATAWVALLGALVAVALALPVAYLAARFPATRTRVVETASYAGHALPGVVVGLSLVFLTLALLPSLYQSMAVLALAYAVLFLPKAIGSSRSAIALVPPGLELVARSQGRTAAAAFGSVTGRVAAPGILAGALLVTVTAMKELPATLMLRPTGFDTLATEMWSRTAIAAYGAAAPYAFALVLVAAVPTLLLARGVVPPRSRPAGAVPDGSLER
jgi:iron(III) transport system permease protein